MSAPAAVLRGNSEVMLTSCKGAAAYFSELAADIAANGGVAEGQTVEEAMIEAHARRQAFAMEMHLGKTERAARARRILAVQIYGDALVAAEIEAMQATDRYESNLRIWGQASAIPRTGGAA